jgi:hypothetical protein
MTVPKELADYVQSAKANHESDEQLMASLKSAGWSHELIMEALAPRPASTFQLDFIRKFRWYILGVLVIALTALGGMRGYSYFTSNPDKIWADTKEKMSDIESAHFNFDASYSEKAPADISKDSEYNFLGASGEIKLSVTGKGDLLVHQKTHDSDYDMLATFGMKLGALNFSVDFESRKVGDYVYYKADGNPLVGLLGGGSANQKSEWAKINLKDTQSKSMELLDLQRQQIIEAFEKAKIMKPTKLIGSDTIDGVSTWHYTATLDKQELKNYFKEVERITEITSDNKQSLNGVIDKVEFKKLEIWIGKADHLIHQTVVETSAPSIVAASSSSASGKSRDARRVSDMHQVQTALELFYNDNGRYPKSSEGLPVVSDGGKNAKFSNYLFSVPVAPTPADGNCTDEKNKYVYEQLDSGKSYRLNFCIGYDSGGLKAGVMEASPSGIQTKVASNAKTPDPFEGVPFDGTIQLKLNLSDFGKSVKIDAPADARDVTSATRDARRVTDVRQMQTAFELFYNDNGRYPVSANGLPSLTDGGQYKLSSYLSTLPTPSTPADGNCTEAQNKYTYQQLNSGRDYQLTFCLGSGASGLAAGSHTASSSGLK